MDSLPKKVIGMSNADYHAQNDFDSRSFLVRVMKGGGPVQKWMDEGRSIWDGNAATSLGSDFDALVTGVCEGRSVDDMLVIAGPEVLTSNGQRRGAKWEEFLAKCLAGGKIPCNEEHAFKLRTMVESLLANPAARKCAEETNETQVSVFFELNGHRLRVRPDGCTPTYWWDLKSTSSEWDTLFRSIFSYGYGEQEWLYVQAAMALGMDHFRMPFVFVHSVPPFDCKVFYLPEDVVAEAGKRMEQTMEMVRLRRLTGEYMPADHGEITELLIPQWARKQEEEVVL